MQLKELKFFLSRGIITEIVLFESAPSVIEVWVYDIHDEKERAAHLADPAYTTLPSGNVLKGARGEYRTYTSFDRAIKAARSWGWSGPIKIDS